ncbi:putative F-box protein [Capsicum galapagoense]
MEQINSNIVPCISHELVVEILKKLPAKALIRFSCISKSFYSLISEPLLIESHQKSIVTQFLVNPVEMSYYNLSKSEEHDQDLATCPIQYLDQPCFCHLRKMQSINGLVCLWNSVEDVSICNPFTKQHVLLPYQQHKRTSDSITSIICTLVFDPITKKHKVLKAHIENRKWRYWIFTIGIDKVIYCVNHYACDIAAFSVGDEKFIRMIPFPVGEWTVRFEESNPRIGDMKGQVALLGHVYFKRGTIFANISQFPCNLYCINNPKGEIVSILGSESEKSPLTILYGIEKKGWRIITRKRNYEQNSL